MNRYERVFRAGFLVFLVAVAWNVVFSVASAESAVSGAFSADLVVGGAVAGAGLMVMVSAWRAAGGRPGR
jgi:hypothetical protein